MGGSATLRPGLPRSAVEPPADPRNLGHTMRLRGPGLLSDLVGKEGIDGVLDRCEHGLIVLAHTKQHVYDWLPDFSATGAYFSLKIDNLEQGVS